MREATRKDLPKQGTNQSQCVLCWRIFDCDGNAEKHKPYARAAEDSGKRGRVAEREECTLPSELGMVGRERAGDGVVIWSNTDDEAYAARMLLMEKARIARKAKTGKK